ncbi:nucleotidyltransferase domain-containing protein [Candidatus Pacearchaeota archaeon]|nr:nucleotidyltransferase domain-containing protein [Candidatus Pacearchaeota archaeon]
MTKKINSILTEVLEKIEPPKKDWEIIEKSLKEFLEKLNKKIKKLKINVEVFVGGSFAKKTMIQKDEYDIDIFMRFDKQYKNQGISKLAWKILKGFSNISVIHGSRDYFKIKVTPKLDLEIIPVIKIKNIKEFENITDLSYSHVKYINKKIKSKELLNEIRIAKLFCHAHRCYGAESYINGFSGYSLELLICHYKSFLKFVKEMVKIKEKAVIDIEKHHKNKQRVLMDLNSSKLNSPIILIDPTYKQRNALAALSKETFERFQKQCKKFLKNPSIKSFEIEKTDLEKIKRMCTAQCTPNCGMKGQRKYEFILLEAKTQKQEGDIAGSKLLKFHKHLAKEIERFFDIKKKGFNYNRKKSARYFFVVKNKKEIILEGPNLNDKKNIMMFKKKHKNTFEKKKRIYAKEKINFTIEKFIVDWDSKNKRKVKEMNITELRIIRN